MVSSTSQIVVTGKIRRRVHPWLVAAFAIVVVAAATVALAILSPSSSPPRLPAGGPYSLTASSGVNLGFPNCTVVTLNWHVVRGNAANFSVWIVGNIPVLNCSEPAPVENVSDGCPSGNFSACINYAEAPVCAEFGMNGSCAFQSDGKANIFDLNPYGKAPSTELVNFTVELS